MLVARSALVRNIARASARSFSIKSSFFEPDPTLFRADQVQLEGEKPSDSLLRADVKAMGSLLGNVIQERQGPDIFDKVEKLRHLAKVILCCQNRWR